MEWLIPIMAIALVVLSFIAGIQTWRARRWRQRFDAVYEQLLSYEVKINLQGIFKRNVQ